MNLPSSRYPTHLLSLLYLPPLPSFLVLPRSISLPLQRIVSHPAQPLLEKCSFLPVGWVVTLPRLLKISFLLIPFSLSLHMDPSLARLKAIRQSLMLSGSSCYLNLQVPT